MDASKGRRRWWRRKRTVERRHKVSQNVLRHIIDDELSKGSSLSSPLASEFWIARTFDVCYFFISNERVYFVWIFLSVFLFLWNIERVVSERRGQRNRLATMTPIRNILPVHKHDVNGRPSHESKHGHHREHHHLEHARARKNALSGYINNKWRNEIVAALAEFAGTFMFLCTSKLFFMSTSAKTLVLGDATSHAALPSSRISEQPQTCQRTSLTLVLPTVFAFGGTQVANTAAIYSDRATAGQEGDGLTQAPNTSILLYISLIFGFSLMVTVWVFFRVSGGLFNPAVSSPHHTTHPSIPTHLPEPQY
jgi:hypothetical protein